MYNIYCSLIIGPIRTACNKLVSRQKRRCVTLYSMKGRSMFFSPVPTYMLPNFRVPGTW